MKRRIDLGNLTSENVELMIKICLYRNDEIVDQDTASAGLVIIKGITVNFGFHPGRLKKNRKAIIEMLAELPKPFMKSYGGGWSFLQACNDKDDNQWTGLHTRMEELFCLGMAIGVVTMPMPRELWPGLPGGMPYYVVDDLIKE